MEHYQQLLAPCEKLWSVLPSGTSVTEVSPYKSGRMKTTRVVVTVPGRSNGYYFVKVVDCHNNVVVER